MKVIWAFIRAGYHPNATELASLLECSTKSIQRDLDFMRDRLGLPFEWDHAWQGYSLTGAPVCSFCCDVKAVTTRFALEPRPMPLTMLKAKPATPNRFVEESRHGAARVVTLKAARKLATARYNKRYYQEVRKGDMA